MNLGGLVFLIIGSVILFYNYKKFLFAQETQKWPMVNGQIVQTYISEHKSGKASRVFRAEIIYQGKGYDRAKKDLLKRNAKTLAERYYQGASLPVYYNPAIPSQNQLYVGMTEQIRGFFILGGLLTFMGFVIFLM
jgi:hypothetical protein